MEQREKAIWENRFEYNMINDVETRKRKQPNETGLPTCRRETQQVYLLGQRSEAIFPSPSHHTDSVLSQRKENFKIQKNGMQIQTNLLNSVSYNNDVRQGEGKGGGHLVDKFVQKKMTFHRLQPTSSEVNKF